MGPGSNWLSFSLSPMEMLRSSESQFVSYSDASSVSDNASHHYFIDNFYSNGWANPNPNPNTKPEVFLPEEKDVEPPDMAANSLLFGNFMGSQQTHTQTQTHSAVPKLEDFLGDSLSMVRYSDNSQTDTQESTLTQIYSDHHHHHSHSRNHHHGHHHHQTSAYFTNDHQDLNVFSGFQAFSTNSGSEVDDSTSMTRTQLASPEFLGHSNESATTARNELAISSCPTNALSLAVNVNSCEKINQNSENNNEKAIVTVPSDSSNKKIGDTFGQRTSIYRGVTRHRWTGRYEAHLWDNSCRREGQARKGRQVYLGGYDKEDKAARSYDLAALKYWGASATTNFPISSYPKELEEMKHMSKQEFIASLRRKSSGFSRGASIYRGVTRHHQQGRWQARIGRVAGNKDLYLGTFATEEEAAEAYDIAAIKFRGMNAVTNFEMNRYDVEAISKCSLPIGGAAKRLKLSLEAEQKPIVNQHNNSNINIINNNININNNNMTLSSIQQVQSIPNSILYDTVTATATALYHQNMFHNYQPSNLAVDDISSTSSMTTAPMTLLQHPAEFYLWPHQY